MVPCSEAVAACISLGMYHYKLTASSLIIRVTHPRSGYPSSLTMAQAQRGALDETDGRCLMALIDISRFLANRIAQRFEFEDLAQVSALRSTDLKACIALQGLAYSYWYRAPAGPGVYEMLLEWTSAQAPSSMHASAFNRQLHGARAGPSQMSDALNLLAQNELQAWPRERVTDQFYLAAEATDGAALMVDSRLEKVYLVVGISQSIGDLVRASGRDLPATFRLTLLPFMDQIVYDGSIMGSPFPPDPSFREKLAATVESAQAAGSIIRRLPKASSAPLLGKRVVLSGLKAKPELNGAFGSALAFDEVKGRYQVALDSGVSVLLKGTNLAEAPQPAGSKVGDGLTLEQREIQAAISQKQTTSQVGDQCFVLRRFGYTEAENPEHMFAVMAGGSGPIPTHSGEMFHKSQSLEFTVDEALQAFSSALESGHWGGKGKPEMLAVDVQGTVDRLKEILGPAGVEVGYYPPPSDEELMSMGGPAAAGVGMRP